MIDCWLLEHLVCPRCRGRVALREGWLVCGESHRYPVVGDIAVGNPHLPGVRAAKRVAAQLGVKHSRKSEA
jgi:hypothetical protein